MSTWNEAPFTVPTLPGAPAPPAAPPAPAPSALDQALSVVYSPSWRAVAGAAAGFHGYRRNDSIGWALGWALLGALFPLIVPVIAVAQGYGRPARISNPRRRRRG